MKTLRTKIIWTISVLLGAWILAGCGSILNSFFPWEDGLIAYYDFDGNVQANTGDDATAHGNPKYVKTNNTLNRAIELDGINDYIELPKQAHLLNGNFTVYLWVKYAPQTNGYGYAALFVQSTKPNNPWDGVSMFVYSYIMARLDHTQELTSNNSNIYDNKWHCLTLVKKDSTLSLFIDGKLDNAVSATHANISQLSSIFIGTNHTDHTKQLYKGAIDELRIYNQALEEDTIKTIYELNRDNLFK